MDSSFILIGLTAVVLFALLCATILTGLDGLQGGL